MSSMNGDELVDVDFTALAGTERRGGRHLTVAQPPSRVRQVDLTDRGSP